jgi:hypothetical protein
VGAGQPGRRRLVSRLSPERQLQPGDFGSTIRPRGASASAIPSAGSDAAENGLVVALQAMYSPLIRSGIGLLTACTRMRTHALESTHGFDLPRAPGLWFETGAPARS